MSQIDSKAIDVVNALFEKIIRLKPAFKQAWPTDYDFQMVKREWLLSFQRNNIHSLNQIKKGIDKLTDAKTAFVPSPGEFIQLCKIGPEDIGLPPTEDAYREACLKSNPTYGEKKNWSHACVQWAARQVSSHTLCSTSRSFSFPLFEKHYMDSVDLFQKGEIRNQIENKQDESVEIKKQKDVVLPQYKNSKGIGDALKILKGGYVDTEKKPANNITNQGEL